MSLVVSGYIRVECRSQRFWGRKSALQINELRERLASSEITFT